MTMPARPVEGLPVPVGRVGLGALPMGPLQRALSDADGARVVRAAVEGGINFIDTATLYRTYAPIRLGLRGWTGSVVIASKTAARTAAGVDADVERARRELDRDVVDIMLLHCARAPFSDGSWDEAWDALERHAAAGRIRLRGISTHSARETARAAARPDVQAIHPLVNLLGMGILEGTRADMEAAVAAAGAAGKFVYAMKALAGGHLIPRRDEAVDYVLGLPGVAAAVVGMVTPDEVEYNTRRARGLPVDAALAARTMPRAAKRLSLLKNICTGCGACVAHCENNALRIVDGHAEVDHDACILCGYCAPRCKLFAIRIV